MFKQLKPINSKAEPLLSLTPNQSYRFAASETMLPIMAGEARWIAREYPIAFSLRPSELPMAIVGIRQGVNAHVNDAGKWQGRYIPAHVRRYPFILVDMTEDKDASERKFAIMYDSEAPHVNNQGTGEALFNDGEASDILKKIEAVLVELHKDAERTKHLVRQIERLGLLTEKPLKIIDNRQNGIELTGIRIVNTDAFARISAENLHELHHTGALSLLHAHFISLTNLTDGLLPTAVTGELSITDKQSETFDFDNIDWSKLLSQ